VKQSTLRILTNTLKLALVTCSSELDLRFARSTPVNRKALRNLSPAL